MKVIDLKGVVSDEVIVCILVDVYVLNGVKKFSTVYYGCFGKISDSLLDNSVISVFPPSYNRLNLYVQ